MQERQLRVLMIDEIEVPVVEMIAKRIVFLNATQKVLHH